MKKLLIIAILLASNGYAQLTKIETFLEQSNTVIKREVKQVGVFKNIKFAVVKGTNVSTGAIQSGLRVEYTINDNPAKSKFFFIDGDELNDLIKAFTDITKYNNQKGAYLYTTRSGVEVGVYSLDDNPGTYVQFIKDIPESYVFFPHVESKPFFDLLIAAKSNM